MPYALAIAVLVACAVDHWLGEPPVRWHPVVWMGNYLGRSGRWVQKRTRQSNPLRAPSQIGSTDPTDAPAFWLGAAAWMVGAAVVVTVGFVLQFGLLWLAGVAVTANAMPGGSASLAVQGTWQHAVAALLAAVLLGLLLKPLMSWALLRKEVLAVEHALSNSNGGSLEAGRERLRWLVSRDVTTMRETQVRESAIETLAENLNDSVVAPIFWFVLLGLPGAALFRFANTADAMWGYPGEYQGSNWQWAGKWAAHADDLLAWLPARLTALLLALVAGGLSWKRLRTEARRTPSPNSGWPMAAMALILDVRLAKPGGYALHIDGLSATSNDTHRAIGYANKAVVALVCIAPAAAIMVAMIWTP